MSALKLRRVDASAHAHAQAIQRWRRTGRHAGLEHMPQRRGYLQFRAQGEGGGWQGLIMAHDWLHHSIPTLQPLLTAECPLSSIVALFRAVPRPLLPDMNELGYEELSDIECVAPTRLPTYPLPWIATPRGRLWLLQLPTPGTACGPVETDSWLSDLPLRLTFVLGISHLSLVSRLRLAQGDVLRINRLTRQCFSIQQCLGTFTLTQEGLRMQPTLADACPEETSGPGAQVDLGALPVRLEFVLATHETNLAMLAQISDGQLIPLSGDVARNIEVRANGKPVARGELVQLDGQLGVELLDVYRDRGDE
ncbi:FliM/FliN family flagellar motor switch protein [Pseudomonas sp. FP198]|uniref:FliM/FliN family flagellar motor switch protein n=1 Tax=Pseudomonas sp. FP198 TaxID=2954084 RepID=UPI00273432A6|nr:FliM/FliN family flagellar motor switch protein [Pseudomonas sp. FP198]WLG97496.1 FliM/FliN family flagellar motor switch protein [Pseudomonas sp. FP198]